MSSKSLSYDCESEATLLKDGKEVTRDKKSTSVDFSSSPDKTGPTIKHNFEGTDIFIEFWSNDPTGAAATGSVKGLLLKTQWTGGFSSSKGLPASFEIPLNPYQLSKHFLVQFKITCSRSDAAVDRSN